MVDRWAEAVTALVWLTRLPLGKFLPAQVPSLSKAAWAFPLVGLVLGGCASVALLIMHMLGLPAVVVAIVTTGSMILLTGGLHEDGLADYADGYGGANRERSLEIMRDSRIGSYGVLSLVLVTGLRIAALAALIESSVTIAACALMAAAVFSRVGMSVALALMPAARRDGLGQAAGRASRGQAAVALVIAAISVILLSIWANGIPHLWGIAAFFGGAAQVWLARGAQRRLGGQTGDVLGAIQQIGEATVLAFLSAKALGPAA
ncbi:adenosylcobinamide-GDP ribazoletransferase [Paracoccus aestuariivivens]|uniref:adenosylcobinamide-GDP ribazoletransferase n=1 Tax=Paracoccus aestuariivivens TaxID=1820333 RepID=UPI001FE5C546|nr:adenosylcobinamide-GDP ribazoletransferase [Paracoccus aestuariivivens]